MLAMVSSKVLGYLITEVLKNPAESGEDGIL